MAVQAQRFLSSRARWFVFLLLIAAAVYLLAVTPARTYLDQRQRMQQAEQRYQVLASANKELTDRTTALQSDAEIARIAREQYELVPKGAQAYAVMPPSAPVSPPAPETAQDEGLWSNVWDNITFWN